jgi:hypothetical protein
MITNVSHPHRQRGVGILTGLAVIVALGLVNLSIASSIVYFIASGTSPRLDGELSTERKRATLSARDVLPFVEGDSIAGCGYRGTLVGPCIASEESLRPKAAELWLVANPGTRSDCLARTKGAYEPVGVLYACLAHPMPAPNLN